MNRRQALGRTWKDSFTLHSSVHHKWDSIHKLEYTASVWWASGGKKSVWMRVEGARCVQSNKRAFKRHRTFICQWFTCTAVEKEAVCKQGVHRAGRGGGWCRSLSSAWLHSHVFHRHPALFKGFSVLPEKKKNMPVRTTRKAWRSAWRQDLHPSDRCKTVSCIAKN